MRGLAVFFHLIFDHGEHGKAREPSLSRSVAFALQPTGAGRPRLDPAMVAVNGLVPAGTKSRTSSRG
jgi:hypothetical protein